MQATVAWVYHLFLFVIRIKADIFNPIEDQITRLPRWLPPLLAAIQIAFLRLSMWRIIIALLWLDITKKAWKIFRESYFSEQFLSFFLSIFLFFLFCLFAVVVVVFFFRSESKWRTNLVFIHFRLPRSSRMASSNDGKFRALLFLASRDITDDLLAEIKFLCKEDLSERDIESTKTPLEFLELLWRQDKIRPGDVGYLTTLLETTRNNYLASKVKRWGKWVCLI